MVKNILIVTFVLSSLSLSAQRNLTTNTGAPIGDNQNSKTIGRNGQVLMEDIHLIEKLAAFDRERIPERVVHARGVGAYGEFTAAADVTPYTKASLFQNGKTTPVFVRFSTVVHGSGSPETLRDPRGFAVKFYTDQGNYDLVGNNLPVFFIRDAMKFPDMVHAFKPSPINNKQDPNRVFDFFYNIPEATHMLTWLYSNYGTPANYRQMDGFGVHAFKWVNAAGEVSYVKYTWKSQQGVENFNTAQAEQKQGEDFQHATVDLYDNIRAGHYPAWQLYVQIINAKDFDALDFNPLDPTKVWPERIAPLKLLGKMTLNRVPDNFFQEVEQAAFSPGTLVPGIEPSEDKLLQGRLFSYFDTQRYRIGANFQQLPVNAAKVPVVTHNQDGAFAMRETHGDVNYQPSASKNTLTDDANFKYATDTFTKVATVQQKISKPNDFTQAGELYRSLSDQDKTDLINNLVADLQQVKDKDVARKMVGYFYMADQDYGKRLAAKLNFSRADVEKLFVAH
ncbi:catalase [Sphingobacterium oryzagri]|uniref:Catalase n=1 Tax=Sphingobacterium oryzagri TaxID=3025669 RepID=A0ABY7WEU9_9SPHI|nr:catalase [Sphingobacterium sp. KACC 22765]WDF68161.1 catalase [Sphingobacterium sp. KACC 22765]